MIAVYLLGQMVDAQLTSNYDMVLSFIVSVESLYVGVYTNLKM